MPKNHPINVAGIADRLRPVIESIATVGMNISGVIARDGLVEDILLQAGVGRNVGGDTQKALDILADDAFCSALQNTGVRWYASEERTDVEMIDEHGTLALAIDPLDGSSNIGVNVPVGTIFSIYGAKDDATASFLRPGSEQIAAGYVVYGPQTAMVLTVGDGVGAYVLDRESERFVATDRCASIPETTGEFAINASNYRHWPAAVRSYVDDCLLGVNGRRAQNFNMRWVGSLVADAHRIMTRGGVFLYPGDSRNGYGNGRLRFLYECAPMAFVIEQAGGGATDGVERLLDCSASAIHARAPLIFGSRLEVDRVAEYFRISGNPIPPGVAGRS